jgi:hypothetical protein
MYLECSRRERQYARFSERKRVDAFYGRQKRRGRYRPGSVKRATPSRLIGIAIVGCVSVCFGRLV